LKIFSLCKHFLWSPWHKFTISMLVNKIGNHFPPAINAFITVHKLFVVFITRHSFRQNLKNKLTTNSDHKRNKVISSSPFIPNQNICTYHRKEMFCISTV
jgi:hypothetical protein